MKLSKLSKRLSKAILLLGGIGILFLGKDIVRADTKAMLCGSNGAVDAIYSAEPLSYNCANRISFTSWAIWNSDRESYEYTGTLAGAERFVTKSEDTYYYEICYSNPVFANRVEFVLRDVSGVKIADSVQLNQSESEKVVYKLKPATEYIITASTENEQGFENSCVAIALNPIKDDVGNTTKKATALTVGKAKSGCIEFDEDVDYFSFKTNKREAFYTISMTNTDLSNMQVELLDNSGMSIASFDISEKETIQEEVELSSNKKYYLRLTSDSEQKGYYKLKVTESLDDVASTVSKAKKINRDKIYKYKIQSKNDADYFVFNSKKVTAYNLVVKNNASSDTSNIEVSVQDEYGRDISNATISAQSAAKLELRDLDENCKYIVCVSGNEPASYSVQYRYQIGKVNYKTSKCSLKKKTDTYIVGGTKKLVKPTKDGYIFKGWYTSLDYSEDTKIASISNELAAEGDTITLYAKWEKVSSKKK